MRALPPVALVLLLVGLLSSVGPPPEAHPRVNTSIWWTRDISRILADRCVACHREGGLAPMALTDYDTARPWAVAIREEVLERHMPPTALRAGAPRFVNAHTMSQAEIDLLVAWVDGGAFRGEPVDPPAADEEPVPDAVVAFTAAGAPGEVPGGWTRERFRAALGERQGAAIRAWTLDVGGRAARVARLVAAGRTIASWTPLSPHIEYPDGVALVAPAELTLEIDGLAGVGTPAPPTLKVWLAREAPRQVVERRMVDCTPTGIALAGAGALLGLRAVPSSPDDVIDVTLVSPDLRDPLARFGPPGAPDPELYRLHTPIPLSANQRLVARGPAACQLEVELAVAAGAVSSRPRGR
ncbi:MAG: cytochrome c [Acidobacteriota bacterium]